MNSKNLSSRDGAAVDAIFMNGRDMDASVPGSPDDAARIRAAYKVLSPLSLLNDDAERVPADLAVRTIKSIKSGNRANAGYRAVNEGRQGTGDSTIS